MFHEDWLINQIRDMVRVIARVVFNKDSSDYEPAGSFSDAQTDLLHRRLHELLAAHQINEAENLLFDSIRADNRNGLLAALDFYSRVNELDDGVLSENDFSREEITSGLEEVKRLFDLPF